MLLASSFATLIESGDAGAQFAADTTKARCAEPGISVYSCLGNVVKTVSASGATFYKPEGKVVSCPNAAPSQIGAECMQMLTPNYCTVQIDCNKLTVPVNNSTVNSTISTKNTSNSTSIVPVKTSTKPKAENKVASEIAIPPAAPASFEFSMDGLALVVMLLGAVSVGVLFTMFKNSISE
jgi:hypothetical protein